MNRHDLLFPTAVGGRAALAGIAPPIQAWARPLVEAGVPLIVRRQEGLEAGMLEVGLSHPSKAAGQRRRALLLLPQEEVSRRLTPFQVLPVAVKRWPELGRLEALATRYGLEAGLYGSTALWAVTGLAYRDAQSDLDIYLRPATAVFPSRSALEGFYREAGALALKLGSRADMELQLADSSACKLGELLGTGRTVLAKGLHGVELKSIGDLLDT